MLARGGPETANGGLPWPTGPQALLLQVAIGPDAGVEKAFLEWRSQINIDDAMDGGSYRLLPLVYERLRKLGVQSDLTGRLKGIYRRSWYENSALFHDMAPVVQALQDAGIKTIVTKGVQLALICYTTHAARPMSDIDVVVPADQGLAAREVLIAMGWPPNPEIKLEWLDQMHSLDYRNASGRQIDVHWHVLREAPAPRADAWFWESAQPFDFQGVRTLRLGATQLLFHIILHGVQSNLEPPIRWIPDSAMLIRNSGKEIDWNELVAFARSQKLTNRLYLGLDFLKHTYDLPVPQATLDALKSVGVSLIERMENVVCLGPVDEAYRPRLYPLVDYWRHLRNENVVKFIAGYPGHLRREWGLRSVWQVPVEAMATLMRNSGRRRPVA